MDYFTKTVIVETIQNVNSSDETPSNFSSLSEVSIPSYNCGFRLMEYFLSPFTVQPSLRLGQEFVGTSFARNSVKLRQNNCLESGAEIRIAYRSLLELYTQGSHLYNNITIPLPLFIVLSSRHPTNFPAHPYLPGFCTQIKIFAPI